jgi:aminoglycoside phosphotransferase (APT) family kinase protein
MTPRELPASVCAAVTAALPDADLNAATPLGEGWAQAAYRVPVPDGDRVLRYPRLANYEGAERPELLDMAIADAEREVDLLPALAACGLPVPTDLVALRDSDGQFVGALHRLIEGAPLKRSMLVGGRRRRLARQLGEFFTRLHAFPPERAVALDLKDIDLWEQEYRPLFDFCTPLVGPATGRWLASTAERFHAEGGMTGAPRVLVHGDVGGEHLRLTGDGDLRGVIDFGDAMVADPALDIAGIQLLCGTPFMDEMLEHYEGEIDPHLRRRAQFYVDAVALYQVRYGDLVRDGQERIDGRRKLAAKAAAATRRGGR